MKIICAGLQKTGTKTMAAALQILGYNVHDFYEQYFFEGELWDKVRKNTATTDDYFQAFENVDAVTDIPACGLWEEIFQAFPDSKVILMVRSSEEEWWKSVENHCQAVSETLKWKMIRFPVGLALYVFGPKFQKFLNFTNAFLPGCSGRGGLFKTPVAAMSKIKYRQHNFYVKSHCPKHQLLVYNVKDGWGPLCKFLGVPVPEIKFPMENVKASHVTEAQSAHYKNYGLWPDVKKGATIRVVGFFTLLSLAVYFLLI